MARHWTHALFSARFRFTATAWFLTLAWAPWCSAAPEVIPGWRLQLVAQSPVVRHPSVVCSAPDGRVFVGEDPMDISAPHNAARGRIVCFHPDGRRTIFADNLHAVFGMQYLEGKLYVLHNPRFTVFTDDDGIGRDPEHLIEQTLPNPWALGWNDHVPANFQLGMDGFFHVAVGDKGMYGAVGRDGTRIDLQGGGIVRMRPDGTQLGIYGTGVRNILDVAMNAEDELFTYDNTDEHEWMGRLTHMVDGGFYGYPHDFIPRRPYTLWMMHDFGGGAATGALAYNEDALPLEYRGNLFLADFGKRQVTRVVLERSGATFRVIRSQELFRNPPADFRPVGIAVSADGRSIYICDWQHRDTKENVETGRLWRLAWAGASEAAPKPAWFQPAAMGRAFEATDDSLRAGLSHPSRAVRLTAQRRLSDRGAAATFRSVLASAEPSSHAKIHALWGLNAIRNGTEWRDPQLALDDPEPMVRRQAMRRAGTERDTNAVPMLVSAMSDLDPSIRFQAATALGHIADARAVTKLIPALDEADPFVRYTVFTALNRIGRSHPEAWPAIIRGLEHTNARIRDHTTFAARDTYEPALVSALIPLAANPQARPSAREAAITLLASMHRQPPRWKGEWWAYHPALAPPPEKTVEWAATPAILDALRARLDDVTAAVRRAATDGLRRAQDVASAPAMRAQLARESDTGARAALFEALGAFRDAAAAQTIVSALARETDSFVLRAALRAGASVGGDTIVVALTNLLHRDGLDPVIATETIESLVRLKATSAVPAIAAQVDSGQQTGTNAIAALGRIGGPEASGILRSLLTNDDVAVRQQAIIALGNLRDRAAVPALLDAWKSAETRAPALEALMRIRDARALDAYLDGLNSANPGVRDRARQALMPMRYAVLPELQRRAAGLPPNVLLALRRVYDGYAPATNGTLFRVAVRSLEPADFERHALREAGDPVRGQRVFFDESGVACLKCHAVGGHGGAVGPNLTLAGAQFSRAALIEHVLHPNRAVREGYQQWIVETREGDDLFGILKSETPETLTLLNADNQLLSVAKQNIVARRMTEMSLMPDGLHAGLTLDQFTDLVAYLESRKIDPNAPIPRVPVPPGYEPLITGAALEGWRELPPGTKRVDAAALQLGRTPEHWHVTNSILEHDGMTGDLWTERELSNFELHLEWRWPGQPQWEQFPLINAHGVEGDDQGHAATARVLDAGDSGVLLRGLYKAQANLFCYPVGSGEVWEYRTDPAMTPQQRRAVTPSRAADRPIGDWNSMVIRLRGDRLEVELNGVPVITNAQLPGIPPRGPIGLQHEHGRIQFRNLWIRELP
jgi:putative membrane-bound dehydrogenase-like protein